MKATYQLERRGQALSAGYKFSLPWKPLTSWRAKIGIVSRVQIQLTTEATHFLESREHASSAGSKSTSPWKPLTNWRGEDRHNQQGPNPAHHGSHSLSGEPRTGMVSAGFKSNSPHKPLTSWRAKNRCGQQGLNPAHHGSHSLPGEPRRGIVSRVKIQLTTETTHFLESQGQVLSARSKSSSPWKSLTNW